MMRSSHMARMKGVFIDLGPKLQCPLKVKEDLSLVLIFQHAILDAK